MYEIFNKFHLDILVKLNSVHYYLFEFYLIKSRSIFACNRKSFDQWKPMVITWDNPICPIEQRSNPLCFCLLACCIGTCLSAMLLLAFLSSLSPVYGGKCLCLLH